MFVKLLKGIINKLEGISFVIPHFGSRNKHTVFCYAKFLSVCTVTMTIYFFLILLEWFYTKVKNSFYF